MEPVCLLTLGVLFLTHTHTWGILPKIQLTVRHGCASERGYPISLPQVPYVYNFRSCGTTDWNLALTEHEEPSKTVH